MNVVQRKGKSTIKSSPKGGVDSHAHEGDVHTVSEIVPKDSLSTEDSKRKEVEKSTAGQRKINLIWEITQMIIAYGGVGAALFVDAVIALRGQDIETTQMAALMQLNSMAALILGFYFSRTNHAAIGGVGAKPMQPYEGR